MKITSRIAYHDYAIMIAHINAEKFFRKNTLEMKEGDNPFVCANDSAVKICAKYIWELKKLYKKHNSHNTSEFKYRNHIANPACFVALGGLDNIFFTAIDNFDLPFYLTSQLDVPVCQTCLAFCPTLESLGIDKNNSMIFCEIEDICKFPLAEGTQAAPAHSFFRERPLLAITYFKLNTMAILGAGLLMQEAIYKAMIKKIQVIWKALYQGTDKDGGEKIYKDIFSQADVESLRCMILDPQGWSDIVVPMFSANYSVSFTIVAALRSLTFSDVFNAIEGDDAVQLKGIIASYGVNDNLLKYAKSINLQGSNTKDITLESNHIFCATCTRIGVSQEQFLQESQSKGFRSYSGYVVPQSYLSVRPGHYGSIKKAAFDDGQYSLKHKFENDYVIFLAGQHDYTYQHLANKINYQSHLFELSDIIEDIKKMRDRKLSSGQNRILPHVYEISTEIGVPIPITAKKGLPGLLWKEINNEDHLQIECILSQLQNNIFGKPGNNLSFVEQLRNSLRILQIPAPLSGAIVYLYIDYANYFSDPFLCDNVLDLYDLFVAVYNLIAIKLPELLEKTQNDNSAGDDPHFSSYFYDNVFCGMDNINDLVDLVDLMENALSHRVQIGFRSAERWNNNLDVRGGGLEQLMNAADAPLKCGLGILRRIMCGDTDVYWPEGLSPQERTLLRAKDHSNLKSRLLPDIEKECREIMGGISRLSYNPRSYIRNHYFTPDANYYISSVDLNVSYLVRPETFYIHFHETAHLIWRLLRKASANNENRRAMTISQISNISELNYERYEEIFSEMLVHCFIFNNSSTTYYRNYISLYSLDPIAYCENDEDTFRRFVEMSLRGFIASDPFREPNIYPSPVNYAKPSKKTIDKAFHRYLEVLDDAACYFYEYRRLWKGDNANDVQRYVEKHFKRMYKKLHKNICCIWKIVESIHKGVQSGVIEDDRFGVCFSDDLQKIDEFKKKIKEGFEAGKPFIRTLFTVREDGKDEKRKYMDVFYLIQNVLSEYLETLFGPEAVDTKKDVLLRRNPKDKRPEFDYYTQKINGGETSSWNPLLLDRYYNGLFSFDPQRRMKYMQDRIVLIKTLWDISTTLRARRMNDILQSQLHPS